MIKYGRMLVLIQNKILSILRAMPFENPPGFGTNPFLVVVPRKNVPLALLTQKINPIGSMCSTFTYLFHLFSPMKKTQPTRIYHISNILSIHSSSRINEFLSGTALASCHHSLQLGCLRYQSFGSFDIKTMPFRKAGLITYSHYIATSCLSIFKQ